MHDAPAAASHEEPTHEEVPALEPEPLSAGEWTIGTVFVLAALALVAWIGWTIASL